MFERKVTYFIFQSIFYFCGYRSVNLPFLLRIYAKPRSNIKLSSPVFSSIQTEYRNTSCIFYRKIWHIETSLSLLLYVICFISAFIYYILSYFYFNSATKKFLIKVLVDNILCPPYFSVKGKPLVKVHIIWSSVIMWKTFLTDTTLEQKDLLLLENLTIGSYLLQQFCVLVTFKLEKIIFTVPSSLIVVLEKIMCFS